MSAASFRLDGKIAWVTGAGSGISRATTVALAKAGAFIVIGDIAPTDAIMRPRTR